MNLEKRIEMLENELKIVKRQKILSRIGFIALFAFIIMVNPIGYISAQSKNLGEVRGTRIVLTDQRGFERAVLSLDEDKGMVGLVMRDELGGASAVLGTSGLNLRDKSGSSRIALVLNTGEPGLALYGEKAKERALLVVDNTGPALSLRDNKGVDHWVTPSTIK
ncbi:hypothetical protein [Desulfatitalea alkaliphila]|uniref:Uncharacterized protein n=1 Tax=Desulfatitalea alkaliphila TaxID=2929485 RepID=A0AA41UM81_9BACT|nr:hypothetical protein [Desulfatitalea alkaliphila]MCJ8503157.1 hypothetical protein [Desulfatitalea alkaliphila]